MVQKNIKKSIMLIMCAVCVGVIISFLIAVGQYLKVDSQNRKEYSINDYINVEEEVEVENQEYIVSKQGGKIEVVFPKKEYINKLQYEYFTKTSQNKESVITIYKDNVYGEKTEETVLDKYTAGISRSVVNIKGNVSKIVFDFPEVIDELKISNLTVDNTFSWNPILAMFISICIMIGLYLIFYRKENSVHPEIATFVCVFLLGACMLMLQPPCHTGWDEQIHFTNSYNMAAVPYDQGTPNIVSYLTNNARCSDGIKSLEERVELIRIMNAKGNEYGEPAAGYNIQISSIGYLFQALFITIGRFLKLPFYLVWLMGKFSNVLLYAICMSIAVWIVPVGKRLLSVISIMPTMVFLSTCYTYDITVTGFLTVGIVIWIREIVNKNEYFTMKSRILFFVCMIVGCMPKAVYAPLILCALFLPQNKFYSTRDKMIFKVAISVGFVLIMSTFILPVLFNVSDVAADSRGGDTSVSRQLEYVIKQPFSYAFVLWTNVKRTFVENSFSDWLGSFAYLQPVSRPYLFGALIGAVALTDTYEEKTVKGKFSMKNRIISLGVIGFSIVLIWTSMYLAFTEVGKVDIAGVQGRYYFPFLFLLYLCFKPSKIKTTYTIEKYQMYTMGIASAMLLYEMYYKILIPTCM